MVDPSCKIDCRDLPASDPVSNQSAPFFNKTSEKQLVIECLGMSAGTMCKLSGSVCRDNLPIERLVPLEKPVADMQKSLSKFNAIEVLDCVNTTPGPIRRDDAGCDGCERLLTVKKLSGTETAKIPLESEQGHGEQDMIKIQVNNFIVEAMSTEEKKTEVALVKHDIARAIGRNLIRTHSTLPREIANLTCENLTTQISNDLPQKKNHPTRKARQEEKDLLSTEIVENGMLGAVAQLPVHSPRQAKKPVKIQSYYAKVYDATPGGESGGGGW